MKQETEPTSVHDVISRLERLGRKVKRRGRRWLAQCPAHDDNTSSLSIAAGEHQPVLLHCFAGCDFHDIMAIVEGERPPVPLSGRSSSKRRRGRSGGGRIVARYPYRDETGRVLYTKLRLDPKSFRFQRAGGRPGLPDDQRRVLYRLDELIAAPAGSLVFIVEGEKDADRLAAAGLLATCTDTGAGTWPAEFSLYLRDLVVAILPDNDEAGRQHGELVATAVAGAAQTVKVIELPGLPDHGDVSDWLDDDHSIEDLLTLCVDAPVWSPAGEGEEERAAAVGRKPNPLDKWPAAPKVPATGMVTTITTRSTSIAPLYENEGDYRDNEMKRHRWIIRRGGQILEEGEGGDVYLLELSDDDAYQRFKDRQSDRRRRLGERREYFGVPQDSGPLFVFHTDEREGGDVVCLEKRALYRLIDHMIDLIPDGRQPSGSQDWGKDYRGSRGDGRQKEEGEILARAQFALAIEKSRGKVKAWSGMERMTVAEIKAVASEKTRADLVAMLADEMQGKQRKTALHFILARIKMNAVQFWTRGKGALRKAATALGIRLHKSGRGEVKIDPLVAYGRLIDAGLQLWTRTGRNAWGAFRDWLLSNGVSSSPADQANSHDFEQYVKAEPTPVRNSGKMGRITPSATGSGRDLIGFSGIP